MLLERHKGQSIGVLPQRGSINKQVSSLLSYGANRYVAPQMSTPRIFYIKFKKLTLNHKNLLQMDMCEKKSNQNVTIEQVHIAQGHYFTNN